MVSRWREKFPRAGKCGEGDGPGEGLRPAARMCGVWSAPDIRHSTPVLPHGVLNLEGKMDVLAECLWARRLADDLGGVQAIHFSPAEQQAGFIRQAGEPFPAQPAAQ